VLITANSPNGQTEIFKKNAGHGSAAIKTLLPAPGFGFILAAPDSRWLSRPP